MNRIKVETLGGPLEGLILQPYVIIKHLIVQLSVKLRPLYGWWRIKNDDLFITITYL